MRVGLKVTRFLRQIDQVEVVGGTLRAAVDVGARLNGIEAGDEGEEEGDGRGAGGDTEVGDEGGAEGGKQVVPQSSPVARL